jgi:two-component system, NtrC family, response regulator PilR
VTVPSDCRLLVIDDEPDLRTLYELSLVREGYEVETAGSVAEALAALNAHSFDAVITDMRLPDGLGLDVLRHLEAQGRRERTVVITAFGSAENAVEALKAGAFDYLTKPVDLRQFRLVVAAALGRGQAAAKVVQRGAPAAATAAAAAAASKAPDTRRSGSTAARPSALERMVGRSVALEDVRLRLLKVARSMAPVLVTGESGTGKELAARAIHEASTRSAGSFVAVNCGAIPEALLEAEFFGYRKGAFTGAQEDRAGFFMAADHGTLFLDEIGELPLSMQAKLLRVIQERSVRPLGATQETPLNVRLVSATHRNLAEDVQVGRFRQDLFYRLNVIPIRLPPLRERAEDLPELVQHLLVRIADEAGLEQVPALAPQALEQLAQHDFPGNVRELENLLHRAVALHADGLIRAADLVTGEGAELRHAEEAPAPATPISAAESSASATDADRASSLPQPGVAPALPTALPQDLAAHLDQVERDILLQALQRHRFNRTAAGASLGLSLRQMRYRMARLGIRDADDAGDA